jgi:nucleoside-diphosphate-sugar epimerase
MSPGDQLIDIVHINDVVAAFLNALKRMQSKIDTKHEHFAVSSQKLISLKKLVSIYEEVHGVILNINWGGRAYRDREVMVPWGGGKKLPNWSPKIGIREGLKSLNV